jgi:hypothetical protein
VPLSRPIQRKHRRKLFQFSHENKFNFTCGMNVNLPLGTYNASLAHFLRWCRAGPRHISQEKRIRGTKAPKWYDNLKFIVQQFIPDLLGNFRLWVDKMRREIQFSLSFLDTFFVVVAPLLCIHRLHLTHHPGREHSRAIIFAIVMRLVIICLWSKKLPICKVCDEIWAELCELPAISASY